MLKEMQQAGFSIIANVGTAKSLFLEALNACKNNDKEKAKQLYAEAVENLNKAHDEHFNLIQKEANGEQLPFSLVLMHAEDQLLSTQTIQILVDELMELYKLKDKE